MPKLHQESLKPKSKTGSIINLSGFNFVELVSLLQTDMNDPGEPLNLSGPVKNPYSDPEADFKLGIETGGMLD